MKDDAAVNVIGAGLAGCEAAYQISRLGVNVRLFEMKPVKKSPAHVSDGYAELVCSNSLRSKQLSNAVGLLKEEMRRLGSLIMEGKDALEAGDFAYISLVPTIAGILVAAAAGYFALRFMLKIIAKVPLSAFAVYLAILGIIFLALQLSGSSLVPAFAPSPAPVG